MVPDRETEWTAGLPFRRVGRAEHARVAATLVEAFRDDPLGEWLFPDGGTRARLSAEFFRATVEWTAAHGGLVMASPGYECVYTAYLPGGDPAEDDVARLPAVRARADALGVSDRMTDQRRRILPPHLYATYCGVEPGARGRGLFRTALAEVAAWCDDRGIAFYCEATSPDGAIRYERAGFPRWGAPIALPDGPSLYPVWRACAAEGGTAPPRALATSSPGDGP